MLNPTKLVTILWHGLEDYTNEQKYCCLVCIRHIYFRIIIWICVPDERGKYTEIKITTR
jgi:hypothetical protein